MFRRYMFGISDGTAAEVLPLIEQSHTHHCRQTTKTISQSPTPSELVTSKNMLNDSVTPVYHG